MGNISLQLEQKLRPALRAGDLTRCERAITERLLKFKSSPFHIAAKLSIRNTPASVAKHCDRLLSGAESIGAAYAEMNGFDINPDSWHYDLFAYKKYGGTRDFDWLAYWDDEDTSKAEIRGLEKLQKVYASEAFESGEFREESDVASLLVVVKFQDLIRRAAPLMKGLAFPLLATAHEYDFIYEARPKGFQAKRPVKRAAMNREESVNACFARFHAGILGRYAQPGQKDTYLEIRADGICIISLEGEQEQVTYTFEGQEVTLNHPRDPLVVQIADGALTFQGDLWPWVGRPADAPGRPNFEISLEWNCRPPGRRRTATPERFRR
jgi:hypothetical protein